MINVNVNKTTDNKCKVEANPVACYRSSLKNMSSSSSAEEVGEQRRDYIGVPRPADTTGAPSTSGIHGARGRRKENQKESSTDSEGATEKTKKVTKVTRKGIATSTPVTVGKERKVKQVRRQRKKKERVPESMKEANDLASAKKRLDEGAFTALSPSSEDDQNYFDSTGSSLREAIAKGELSETDIEKRACPAKYCLQENERECPAKYCPQENERECPAKYDPDLSATRK